MSTVTPIKKTFFIRKRTATVFDIKTAFVKQYMNDDKILPTFILVDINGKPGLIRKDFKDIDKTTSYFQVRRRSQHSYYISSVDMARALKVNDATKGATILKATPFVENDMEGCILERAKEEDLL